MDPYEKKLLEETAQLSKDNNHMLHSMQRAARWAQFFVLVKWIVIIGLTVGAYYYVEPYLQTLLKVYNQFGGSVPSVSVFQEGYKNVQDWESSLKEKYSGNATTSTTTAQ